MACTPARSHQIAELAAGRLEAAALASALDHLELCADCSRELDAVACVLAGEPAALGTARGAGRASASWPLRLTLRVAAAAAALVLAFALAELFSPVGAPDSGAGVADLADTRPLPGPALVLRGPVVEVDAAAAGAFEAGARAYAAGEWSLAARSFERAARAGRAGARLYAGVAHLQARELDAARERLAEAAATASGREREQALWYLANAALLAGDATAAREALVRLAAEDGDYALNAGATLARLDERLSR